MTKIMLTKIKKISYFFEKKCGFFSGFQDFQDFSRFFKNFKIFPEFQDFNYD